MQKTFLIIGAIFGALAVALGAFAAHGLKRIADSDTVNVFHTGVEYQFYHAFALLAVGILYVQFPSAWLQRSGWCLTIGTILFSGSLYLITILKVNGAGSLGPAGILTPIGGLFFIVGWIFLLIGLIRVAA
jgi:uncharacterized membrane protein YgdD (TMEM256/DUF423 family)